MNGKALWVVLEAKPGKEAEVEKFLQAGQGLVEAEPKTVSCNSDWTIHVRHLRYVRRRLRSRCASEWQGSAGLDRESPRTSSEITFDREDRCDRVEAPEVIAQRAELVRTKPSDLKPDQLRFKLRVSLSTKFASRRPRLRTNRHGPASTK